MEQVLKKMKKGYTTKIDELGRIHIPIQIRNILDIKERDKLCVYRSGTNIILEKSNIKVDKKVVFEEKQLIDGDTEIHITISKIKDSILENTKGILRVVDELGNYIIPIEIRKELNITERNTFKICVNDNKIILIKNRETL